MKYAELVKYKAKDDSSVTSVKDITILDSNYADHRRKIYQLFHTDVFDSFNIPKTARVHDGEK